MFLFLEKSFAGIGTENCYCYNVAFNNKLLNYKLPQYDISEFKKVKKGFKKENPLDIYKYAVFMLTNNEHGLISIKEIDKLIKKNKILIKNNTNEEKRLSIALKLLLYLAQLNHKESQFFFYYLSLKRSGNPKLNINFLQKSAAKNYEPAIELMAQLYLASNMIEINNELPFKDDKSYLFYQSNLLEASKLLEKLPNNKDAQFELGKIYLSKEYNQYNQNIDFYKVKSLFENIGKLDYFNQKINSTYDYRYIINYSNLFPKVKANILTNKSISENQAYDLINQFNEYESIFTENDNKNIKYSILGCVDIIEQNLYPDYEDYVFKRVKDYSFYSIEEDSWFKTLSKENKLEILKYLDNIFDANMYLKRFKNGKYINETNEILQSIYVNSKELYDNFQNKYAFQNYIKLFPKSPYKYEFEIKLDNIVQRESIVNERMKKEQLILENEKERILKLYQPQIEAFNKLASSYAYSYMKKLSPNTGRNASFQFNTDDFQNNIREVTLRWEAKFTSSGVVEYLGNMAGLSNPYEEYEIYGSINVNEGSFTIHSQNSWVSTLEEFNSIVNVSKEYAMYAIKNIYDTVKNTSSNYSNESYSNNSKTRDKELSECENKSIKEYNELRNEIITNAWEDKSLSEHKKQFVQFSSSLRGYIFKDKDGKFYIDNNSISNKYYKDYNAAIYALYVYKRCSIITNLGKSN